MPSFKNLPNYSSLAVAAGSCRQTHSTKQSNKLLFLSVGPAGAPAFALPWDSPPKFNVVPQLLLPP